MLSNHNILEFRPCCLAHDSICIARLERRDAWSLGQKAILLCALD